nr:MAG TPA: hypothetical protein [Caudoviricetes sp.]
MEKNHKNLKLERLSERSRVSIDTTFEKNHANYKRRYSLIYIQL